ncbi:MULTISPECIES: hypothetical protein [Streptomyces]|nr:MULTISPECIES: hypothetical protein [Streptomyces]
MTAMVAGGTDNATAARPGRYRRLAGAASVTFAAATATGLHTWQ